MRSDRDVDPECWHKLDLTRMLSALKHRGPDSSQIWESQGVRLAHCRLSILDLSSRGLQPMTLDKCTITYNGEVYNYIELRQELISFGYTFDSGTDTEVVLRAYQHWGPGCLDRLNGMFAFAIWNEREKTLFLARDRVGIKPLYWHQSKGVFLFASEAKAMLLSGIVERNPDWDAVTSQVLAQSYYETNPARTLLAGVRLLPPGHWLLLRHGEQPQIRPYWAFPEFEEERYRSSSLAELAEEYRALFEECVRMQLVSDVPVASFLSGGLDSSLLNAVAARLHQQGPIQAFTIRYSSPIDPRPSSADADEDMLYSGYMRDFLGEKLCHRWVDVEPSALTLSWLDTFFDFAWLPDDIRYPSLFRNYQAIHQHGLKVVLNGQGPDETMAGYIATNPFVNGALDSASAAGIAARVLPMLSLISQDKQTPWLAARRARVFQEVADFYDRQPGGALRKGHLFLSKTLLRRILIMEDFMSMKFGVECRVPFLDHRLVEFAFSVPYESHVDIQVPKGKLLMRQAAARCLPLKVAQRGKLPFPSPDLPSLLRAILTIYRENFEAINRSEMVQAVYQTRFLTPEATGLVPQDLWLLVILWRFEHLLKNTV